MTKAVETAAICEGRFVMKTLSVTKLLFCASLFVVQASLAAATSTSCRLQNDVTVLVADMHSFLTYLETGEGAEAIWLTKRHAQDAAGLQNRLKQAGHDRLAMRTGALAKQQKKLLFSHEQSGRRTTAMSAREMNITPLLQVMEKENAVLPCAAPMQHEGAGAANFGSGAAQLLESGVLHLFGAAILIGGVVLAAFGWWNQISQRRTRRYGCMLPCTVTDANSLYPAMIVNVSRSGAKLQIARGLDSGHRVELNFLGERAPARVVRCSKDHMMLDFDEMMNTELLDRALFNLKQGPQEEFSLES
ncbi:hypothetical protein RSK20926_21440 [Roseobacter sp. SK209-2-6]|nr:hypothetical protein RSK20926_21440 [Roseobacter sp. SK209-2-6]